MQYPFQFQVSLVIALCVVHNFIRRNGGEHDYYNRQPVKAQRRDRVDLENVQSESVHAKRLRDEIATRMWSDYQQ